VCVGTEPEVQPESNEDTDFHVLDLARIFEAKGEVEVGQEYFWGQEVPASTTWAVNAAAI
jgi:hypothetical protein